MLVVTNGTLITPEETIADGRVVMQGDTILAAGPATQVELPAGAAVLDAERGFICPGFIDLHVHGLMGHSVSDGEVAEVAALLPAYGVTSFLATTVPDAPANLLKVLTTTLDNARRARIADNAPRRARVLGLHLLGPWLSPAQPGTLDPSQFRLFDRAEWQKLHEAAGKFLRLVTLAPELVENTQAIETMRSAGTCVSLGYSTASYEQTLAAAAAGAGRLTYAFDHLAPFQPDAPGVQAVGLVDDRLTLGLVLDEERLAPGTLSLLLRCKGVARLNLVSASLPASGLPPGRYPWGKRTIHSDGATLHLADGTWVGSSASLVDGVATLMRLAGLSLAEAVRTVTTVPAKLLGLELGMIAPNRPADVVVIDGGGRVRATVIRGTVVYPVQPRFGLKHPPGRRRYGHKMPQWLTRVVETAPEYNGLSYSMREASDVGDVAAQAAIAYLKAKSNTVEVRDVSLDPAYQQDDIDLIWIYRHPEGYLGQTTIEVKGDRWDQTGNFFFETVSNKERNTPGCFMYTRANLLYYYFVATQELYILPMPATRRWFAPLQGQFAEKSTTTPVGGARYTTVGRLVPIEEVLAGVSGVEKIVLAKG